MRRPAPTSGRPPREQVAHDQTGEHAVAGGREIGEHDVARLLPPIARSCSAIAVVTLRSPTGVSTISTPAARAHVATRGSTSR